MRWGNLQILQILQVSVPSLKIGQKFGISAWPVPSGSNMYEGSSDATLFSSSLPVLPHEKFISPDADLTDASSELREENKDAVQDDYNVHVIGSLLPNVEEALLAGVLEDFFFPGVYGGLRQHQFFILLLD